MPEYPTVLLALRSESGGGGHDCEKERNLIP